MQRIFVLFGALGLGLAVPFEGVQEARKAPLVASPVERPVARLAGGRIVRDRETLRAIEESRSTALPRDGAGLRLEITKSRYRIDVLDGERRLAVYPVALGRPDGAKQRQGDRRTPEGEYLLVPHHPSPRFGGCFYVAYPNRQDAERGLAARLIGASARRRILTALDAGRLPPHDTALGGLILLHGTRDRSVRGLTTRNWTLGCIAMENEDLLKLLALFGSRDRPRVRILP